MFCEQNIKTGDSVVARNGDIGKKHDHDYNDHNHDHNDHLDKTRKQ